MEVEALFREPVIKTLICWSPRCSAKGTQQPMFRPREDRRQTTYPIGAPLRHLSRSRLQCEAVSLVPQPPNERLHAGHRTGRAGAGERNDPKQTSLFDLPVVHEPAS